MTTESGPERPIAARSSRKRHKSSTRSRELRNREPRPRGRKSDSDLPHNPQDLPAQELNPSN